QLWKARNLMTFEGKTSPMEEEIRKAMKGFDVFWSIQTTDEGRRLNANPPNPMRQSWEAPHNDLIKLNVDAAAPNVALE
ncbi:hypothetical protein PIB30_105761, partial [Stylosanthes scabra]|nr:hypothetical protein [Stylosanthes scabra]